MRIADHIRRAALDIEHEADRLKGCWLSGGNTAWRIADRARDLLRLAERVADLERQREADNSRR